MWQSRRVTTLWAFTVCYRDSFTFILPLVSLVYYLVSSVSPLIFSFFRSSSFPPHYPLFLVIVSFSELLSTFIRVCFSFLLLTVTQNLNGLVSCFHTSSLQLSSQFGLLKHRGDTPRSSLHLQLRVTTHLSIPPPSCSLTGCSHLTSPSPGNVTVSCSGLNWYGQSPSHASIIDHCRC
jgi:hypothetical protein